MVRFALCHWLNGRMPAACTATCWLSLVLLIRSKLTVLCSPSCVAKMLTGPCASCKGTTLCWSWANNCIVRNVVPLQDAQRSEEHTSELQSHSDLVCRL